MLLLQKFFIKKMQRAVIIRDFICLLCNSLGNLNYHLACFHRKKILDRERKEPFHYYKGDTVRAYFDIWDGKKIRTHIDHYPLQK